MKKIKQVVGVIIMLVALAGGYVAYLAFHSPFQMPVKSYLYIDNDDTADSIRTKIQHVGEASTMAGYDLVSSLLKYGDRHRSGRYAISPDENMLTLVRKLRNGSQEPVKLVIQSVRTVDREISHLAKQLMLDSLSLASILHDAQQIKDLGAYTEATLPCLFLPNTYEVYWDITPEKLVKRLQTEKEKFWNGERTSKAKAAGLSIPEVVTLASIVESETNYGPEKAKVAGLYLNRLHQGMKLQSDPTVKFALQKFALRRILHQHLTYDSPYNTYMYEGLPPGPICIPSPACIDAVLNYEKHNYLYMCAKEDFSGSHNFAVGFAEHMQNARKYQQALNARGIR